MIEYDKLYRLIYAYIIHISNAAMMDTQRFRYDCHQRDCKEVVSMPLGDIHWILRPFETYHKIPERRLLRQCRTPENLAWLLEDGYIVLLSEDHYGKTTP